MKKILLTMLVSVSLLAGCGDSKVMKNMEYVGEVESKSNMIVQFKDENGKIHNLSWILDKNSVKHRAVPMVVGEKYNVEVSVEDKWSYGDYVREVESTK